MNSGDSMNMNTICMIVMLIIIIILFMKVEKISKNNDQENATNTVPTITDAQLTAINNQISQIYNMDVEAIRNLGAISKSLLTGTNYHSTTVGVPGELTIPANNTVFKGDIIVDGKIEFTNKDTLLMDILPRGIILSFNSMNPPLGWTLCNGLNGAPDLRGRFVLGSGKGTDLIDRIINTTGGEENHTLTIPEMPSHRHLIEKQIIQLNEREARNVRYIKQTEGPDNFNSETVQSRATGGGQDGQTKPHNNMPPFYVLTYIMKL
jgi:hypothetical protein